MLGTESKPLPFSWTFERIIEKGILKAGDSLWFKQKMAKYSESASDEDTILPPQTQPKETPASSSEPNANKESALKEQIRKAESNAFLNKVSYAKKAAGSNTEEEKPPVNSALSDTECAISEDIRTGRQTPNTDMCNTVFWDLLTFKGEMEEIKEAAKSSGAIGWMHRKQTGWLELAYASIKKRDQALAK